MWPGLTEGILRVFLQVATICFALCGAASGQIAGELIYAPGSVPFAASHASTLVELPYGELLAAWFGGTAESRPDVAIYTARRAHDAWEKPVEVAREPGVPCWNPVLFHTHNGHLWLYYKYGPSPGTWTAARKHSEDEGRTWSAAEHLPAGLLGPIRTKPLVLEDGTIVSGSSVESYRMWAVWIERSTDGGKTWTKIGPIVPPRDLTGPDAKEIPSDIPGSGDWKYTEGIIQPSVVSLDGRHLRLYARSTAKTLHVAVADSFDNGVTWTAARAIDVPNPNSGIDVVTLRDGRQVMIYNNTTRARTPLNLAVSGDGEHFTMFQTLEDRPGEYSYPALIQTANGDLEMTYTYDRKSIRHVHLPLSMVPAAP